MLGFSLVNILSPKQTLLSYFQLFISQVGIIPMKRILANQKPIPLKYVNMVNLTMFGNMLDTKYSLVYVN